ncbi:MAG: hypothetical protein ACK2T6_08430 [Anaerolineae bacterium]
MYRLSYTGDVEVTYEVDLDHPDVTRGRLAVREASSGRYPLSGAGLYYRRLDGVLVEPWLQGRLGQVDSIEHELVDGEVRITVQETLEQVRHTKRYTLRLQGRSLEVRAQSLDARRPASGAYGGFTSGDIAGTVDVASVRLPYMDAVPVAMLDHEWFASTLVDYPRSASSLLLPRGPEVATNGLTYEVAALYAGDADGSVEPVDETVWVTVSPDAYDTFAVPVNAPSPRRQDVVGGVHLTLTGRAPAATFGSDSDYLARLRDWGASELVVHKQHWRDGSGLVPLEGPPDQAAGGVAGLEALATAAGGLLAPSVGYTTTTESCPGQPNPAYRSDDRVTGPDGAAKRLSEVGGGARDCPGGGSVGVYLLAPDAARRVAATDGDARGIPGAGALTFETLAAWNPGYAWPGADANALDRAGDFGHPATVGEAVREYMRLFRGLQEELGPVFGDGAYGLWPVGYDSFYAGYVDGVSRSLSTGAQDMSFGDADLVVPDYELTVQRPLATHYGMGPYERFFGPLSDGALSDEQIDSLRATSLAYGHAGAFEVAHGSGADERLTAAEQLKEYYLMRALQTRYFGAEDVVVRYVDTGGTSRDLSQALASGAQLATPRLHLAYDGGLELWVNHSPTSWTVLHHGSALALPPMGWLASSADLDAFSATVAGRRVDYLSADGVTLVDGRGHETEMDGLVTTDLKIRLADGRVLAEQPGGDVAFEP